MKITHLEAHPLYAELSAPMRSRGNVGFTEYFHTGSENQRLTAVEVVTDAGHRGITLLGGDARGWIEAVAAPALAGADPRAIRRCRRALVEALRKAPEEFHRQGPGCVNR